MTWKDPALSFQSPAAGQLSRTRLCWACAAGMARYQEPGGSVGALILDGHRRFSEWKYGFSGVLTKPGEECDWPLGLSPRDTT